MDVIIQIIIIFIIIVSVLKRIQDVDKKGQELDKTKIPGQLFGKPDIREALKKVEQKLSETAMPEVTVEVSEEPVGAPVEPVEAQTMFEEKIFETQPEQLIPEEQEYFKEPVPEIPIPVRHKPATAVRREPQKGLELGFTAPQVIKGIIMGEILGQPVSMRNDERI